MIVHVFCIESNMITECNHQFCTNCICNWYKKNSCCPYCKQELLKIIIKLLNLIKYIKLFFFIILIMCSFEQYTDFLENKHNFELSKYNSKL